MLVPWRDDGGDGCARGAARARRARDLRRRQRARRVGQRAAARDDRAAEQHRRVDRRADGPARAGRRSRRPARARLLAAGAEARATSCSIRRTSPMSCDWPARGPSPPPRASRRCPPPAACRPARSTPRTSRRATFRRRSTRTSRSSRKTSCRRCSRTRSRCRRSISRCPAKRSTPPRSRSLRRCRATSGARSSTRLTTRVRPLRPAAPNLVAQRKPLEMPAAAAAAGARSFRSPIRPIHPTPSGSGWRGCRTSGSCGGVSSPIATISPARRCASRRLDERHRRRARARTPRRDSV